jgi:hypothetical protein
MIVIILDKKKSMTIPSSEKDSVTAEFNSILINATIIEEKNKIIFLHYYS